MFSSPGRCCQFVQLIGARTVDLWATPSRFWKPGENDGLTSGTRQRQRITDAVGPICVFSRSYLSNLGAFDVDSMRRCWVELVVTEPLRAPGLYGLWGLGV